MAKRVCRVCGASKPAEQFSRNHRMPDGRIHQCKACELVKGRAYRAANRGRIAAQKAARYLLVGPEIQAQRRRRYRDDDQYREKAMRCAKESRIRHIEQARARARERYRRNRDEVNRATTERNRHLPPGLRAEYQRRMRARQKGATIVTLTLAEWAEVCARYDNACAYCGSRKDLGMDHQLPMQRGGGHEKSNVVPCCRSCNTSKGTQTPEEWQKKRRRT